MPRYAIVIGGVVDNVIEADAAVAASHAAGKGGTAVLAAAAGPGDSFSGGVFVPVVRAPAVPATVTRYAFFEGAEDALGVTRSAIDAAVSAMADGRPKRRLSNWLVNAPTFNRQGARMNDLQTLLGWSNAQVRQIFAAAELIAD
jgi:hypothetical protein